MLPLSTAGARVNRVPAAEAMKELADRGAGDGVAPIGGDLGKRLQHEEAIAKGGVGDEQSLALIGAAGP